MIRFLAVILAAGLFASGAQAQTLAITNAQILTLGEMGDIPRGTVIVRDGRISAVGADVRVPAGMRVLDAKGQVLTPGLVETVSSLGLRDLVSLSASTGPQGERVSVAYEVVRDFNPNNPLVAEARLEGVTRAILAPAEQPRGPAGAGSGPFAGQAGVVRLALDDASVTDGAAAVAVVIGSGGRGDDFAVLEGALQLARRGTLAADPASNYGLSQADLTRLARVARRERPLLVEVDRASDIRNVLDLAHRLDIRIVLSGAAEAWMLAEEIARAGIPVIVDGEANQAVMSYDSLNATYENAAILTRAGVLVAFKPGFSRILVLTRTPRLIAGRAARYGLEPHAALAAITLNPARIFGFADRTGSVEVGKDADLVLWDGDPLETTTLAQAVLIRGVEQPMTAHNRALRDRYLPRVRQGADGASPRPQPPAAPLATASHEKQP